MGLFDKLFGKKEKESLDQGLQKTKEGFLSRLTKVIAGKSTVDEEVLDNLEDALVSADVGIDTTVKIIQQIEKRVNFRRVLRQTLKRCQQAGAKGVKLMVSGRLNGAEMSRREWYLRGRIPLHTLRADIDYGFAEAKTTYGVIGIKVWVFKGETIGKGERPVGPAADAPADTPAPTRRPRKTGAKQNAAAS